MFKIFVPVLVFFVGMVSCHPARHINKVIAPKDTTAVPVYNVDSIREVNNTLQLFNSHRIDFRTFSTKIKAEVETSKQKFPDLTAVVRIIKDSAIWMSVSATFLNIEVYRVLITRDSVILLNKKDKEVQYRSLDYLQEVTEIPFDFATIQNLLIGNPIFFNDSIQSYKKYDNFILLSSAGIYFKHFLNISTDNKLLLHSKLDDIDVTRNRTADINYDDYENINGLLFSTNRRIVIAEKNKIDMRLKYKQLEFNKDLSVAFPIPKNFTRK